MPEMDSTQMSATLTMPDDAEEEDVYQASDKFMERALEIEDIQTIGAMQSSTLMGMGSSDSKEMTFYLLLDENKKQSSKEIARLLEEKTADLGGEVLVQESNMDMSMLGGSGIELEVRGTDLDQMEEIVRLSLIHISIVYVIFCLVVMVCNFKEIPGALVTIFESAFGLKAVAGGALGSIMVAMQMGIARGIFSNEAGLGSAPIAAAAAKTKEPVRQGLVSMTGTFIDTIVICTLTGLTIVLTGAYQSGLEGVAVTTKAFQEGLPFSPEVASFILMVCLVFFAFTTILGWDYYSERCLEYLSGGNQKLVLGFRWLYILCVFIGPYMTISAVWTIADIFNGLMALPNLVALFALNGVIVAETKKYFDRQKESPLQK